MSPISQHEEPAVATARWVYWALGLWVLGLAKNFGHLSDNWTVFLKYHGSQYVLQPPDYLNLGVTLAHEVHGHVIKGLRHPKTLPSGVEDPIWKAYEDTIHDAAIKAAQTKKEGCCRIPPNKGKPFRTRWQEIMCICKIPY